MKDKETISARNVSPIVAPDDAKHRVGHAGVVFVDARGGADSCERYKAGHVAGSVFIDLETQLSAKGPDPAFGGRHPLPHPDAFGTMLGKMGITPSSRLLVYDDRSGSNAAARFWWMMMAAGHRDVQVVDGGLAGLLAAGAPIEIGEPPTTRHEKPYPVRRWELPQVDLETVDMARSANDWLIIDVRENYRYRGESEPIDLVAGHIPGAVNAPYVDNLDGQGRFKSPELLRELFGSLMGSRRPQKVIVHCGSGVTACHTLLAMELAGLRGANLYPGSWSEWSRRGKAIQSTQA